MADSSYGSTPFWLQPFLRLFGSSYDLYKIPSPKSRLLSGHLLELLRPDYNVKVLEWSEQCGGICRFSMGPLQHIILVSDPVVAASILGRGDCSVPRKCFGYRFFDLATNQKGNATFFTTADEGHWRHMRKTIAPAFSAANIRQCFPCLLRHAQALQRYIAEKPAGQPMEVQNHLEMLLLAVFFEGLLSIDSKGYDMHHVAESLSFLLEEGNHRIKWPFRFITISLEDTRKIREAQQALEDTYAHVYDVISSRGPPAPEETQLWACLMRLRDSKTGSPMSKEQVMAEIGILMVAGFDTSSQTIAWCIYAIASHPEVQSKIKEELQEAGLLVAPGQAAHDPSYEEICELRYLCATVDEAMRMYPVGATASVREASRATRVGPYTVPAGTMIWPMVYALHNNSNNWDEPHAFKPERWFEEKAGYHPKSGAKRFMPFSDGLKNCMGQALGLMEVRTVLAVLLASFHITLAEDAGSRQPKMLMALTLKIKDGLRIVCTPHSTQKRELLQAGSHAPAENGAEGFKDGSHMNGGGVENGCCCSAQGNAGLDVQTVACTDGLSCIAHANGGARELSPAGHCLAHE